MYNNFLGKNVKVCVSSKSDMVFEYTGLLESEDQDNIMLTDSTIKIVASVATKGIFGGGFTTIDENVSKSIISKKYIISCSVK